MFERTIYPKILKTIQNRPVTLITGARQVGKSTLCKKIVEDLHFNYVTLDNLADRRQALEDPELFLKLHPWPLIIDEVQQAPKLFEVLEQIVNEEKFKNNYNYGMYVLTGSQIYKLMEGISESMAGRVSIIRMSPLSMSEINNVKESPFTIDTDANFKRSNNYTIKIDDLYEKIVRGMYPELYENTALDADDFYSDYVDTYVNRDVTKIIDVKDKLKFTNFMEILASFTGEELVYETIAKAISASIPTIQSWISVLMAGDLIYLLEPYNENSTLKRVVKRPKIYFSDTGLACYLSRLNNPKTLQVSRFSGQFIETYIVNEIMKSYKNNNAKANFYYYRDSNQREIDLIILNNGLLQLIECKQGIRYTTKDVKTFDLLTSHSRYAIQGSCIICNTDKVYTLRNGSLVLPISTI